ncbi:MAG: hypothetical protein LBU23_06110 [Planctomycetota bacterium]|nr:hypothetical protein [Planctomycetota bacterium]
MGIGKLGAALFALLIFAAATEAAEELPLRGKTANGGRGMNSFQADWRQEANRKAAAGGSAPAGKYLAWRNSCAASTQDRENFALAAPCLGLRGAESGRGRLAGGWPADWPDWLERAFSPETKR